MSSWDLPTTIVMAKKNTREQGTLYQGTRYGGTSDSIRYIHMAGKNYYMYKLFSVIS